MTKLNIHAINGYAVRLAVATVVMAGLALSHTAVQAAPVTPGKYTLLDHLDGNLNTDYGLRIDQICAILNDCSGTPTSDERTFSVENAPGVVTLDWTGDLTTARITGDLQRNSDSTIWAVDFLITGIVTESGGGVLGTGDGWTADGTTANYGGTLSLTTGTTVISLTGKNKSGTSIGFEFDNDGARCDNPPSGPAHGAPCAPDAIVGEGWVIADGIMAPTNDWLVIAQRDPDTTVPEPGTMALFGFGLVGLGYARRRRLI